MVYVRSMGIHSPLSALVHPPVRATIDDEMIADSLLIISDLISQWITILRLRNEKYQITKRILAVDRAWAPTRNSSLVFNVEKTKSKQPGEVTESLINTSTSVRTGQNRGDQERAKENVSLDHH